MLDLIHTDVCGPLRSPTTDGRHYYVTFTDDFSRYGYVYLIRQKSDTFEKSKEYRNKVKNRLGKKIKVLRSDRGGEYLSIKFNDYLRDCGIVSQLIPPRTPQLNGVAERINRTLLDMVRCMMSRASLPITFWGYALEIDAHILNRVPTKKVSKTPFKMWSGKVPSLKHTKICGYEALLKAIPRTNLNPDPKDVESTDHEPIADTSVQPEVEQLVEPVDESLPLRRTPRVRNLPQFYGFHITAGGDTLIGDKTLINLHEPSNYKESMAGPEAAQWQEAMNSEIQSMKNNQVWNLVKPTHGLKTVGCRWIFKNKIDMDENVHTFKAKLVAKGYTQTHSIDYDETFSPVAKIKSIRILLAIVAFHDYEIWKMDIKTAFVHGKLEEDKIKEYGFSRSPDESCVYVKASGSVFVFLVLYVDDMLLIGNSVPELQSVKVWLGKCFAMKYLGEAVMENSKKGNVPIHHSVKLSKSQCPSSSDEHDQMSRVPYASAIGSIMYAMICTHPDVSYALTMVSRYQENLGLSHWTTIKNIPKYLRNTKEMLLVYGGEQELKVRGYSDASFQTDRDDSKSQSDWVFTLNRGTVTWKSSKQDTVALSTSKYEYIAASEASKEATWIKNFIGDLGVVPSNKDPIEIFCDNEEEGEIIVKQVSSDENPADPFTKGLAHDKHSIHAKGIGMKNEVKF
ncbi:hypothetical protein LXL04_035040 [Taraxacum kok-saghyz]